MTAISGGSLVVNSLLCKIHPIKLNCKIMITKINDNRIESSEGYALQFTHLHYCQYQEKDAFVNIEWFYDAKNNIIHINGNNIVYWSYPENALIANEDRIRINKNIDAALTFLCNEMKITYHNYFNE
jgi:hypothetical protein